MAIDNITSQIASINPKLAEAMNNSPWIFPVIIAQLIMKLVFYPWALYKAAERKQKTWFIVLMIAFIGLNDFGLLPILYLIINKDKKQISPKKNKKK